MNVILPPMPVAASSKNYRSIHLAYLQILAHLRYKRMPVGAKEYNNAGFLNEYFLTLLIDLLALFITGRCASGDEQFLKAFIIEMPGVVVRSICIEGGNPVRIRNMARYPLIRQSYSPERRREL